VIHQPPFRELTQYLLQRARRRRSRRYLVGIAGIPGSGKSTFARLLVDQLNAMAPGLAVLVPMDGFHLPNRRLEELGLRERKGAPETFDAEGFIRSLSRARDLSQEVFFPVYDRNVHEPVLRANDDQKISSGTRLILTEGNYLLLTLDPWARLAGILDECWFLDTSLGVAKQWIIDRFCRYGVDPEAAQAHYHEVDLPNAELVLANMREPQRRIPWPGGRLPEGD